MCSRSNVWIHSFYPSILRAEWYCCLRSSVCLFFCPSERRMANMWLKHDLGKAFDSLPHYLAICKLRSYGVVSVRSYGVLREACTLIASGHKKRIKLGNSRGEWAKLLKSVPRGSILGPLSLTLFLMIYSILYPKAICITTPLIAVSVPRIKAWACWVHNWRMEPRLCQNGLVIIIWKQTQTCSNEWEASIH